MEPNKLFVYGILKRGLALDLTKHGAKFLAEGHIKGAVLLDFGYGTGLRFVKDPVQVAFGELFKIPGPESYLATDEPNSLWPWLDYIESNGVNYRRVVVDVWGNDTGDGAVKAWVYEHIYYDAHGGYEGMPIIKGGNFHG